MEDQHEVKFYEQFSYITTRIEGIDNRSGKTATGTAFFFVYPISDGGVIQVLVTNKHVVEHMDAATITVPIKNSADSFRFGKRFGIKYERDFLRNWIFHPNPDVDLCVMRVNIFLQSLEILGHKPFYRALFSDNIPTDEDLAALDLFREVLFVGYPDDTYDEVNNKPIFRRGHTATDLRLNYKARPHFLIDAAIFHGSSGSPVLIPKGPIKNRLLLVGIIKSCSNHFASAVLDENHEVTSTVKMPNHSGEAVHAKYLLDFLPLLLSNLAPEFDGVFQEKRVFLS